MAPQRVLLVLLALLAPVLAAQERGAAPATREVPATALEAVPEAASEVAPELVSEVESEPVPEASPAPDVPPSQAAAIAASMPSGDAERGRLVFGACRTCHYPQAVMGHNNGPSLHRIFGKVAGKQEGFEYYSEVFKAAEFVWTPQVMYAWLENPMAMFPGSTMMSLGVADPQRRADLIAYLEQASVRDP